MDMLEMARNLGKEIQNSEVYQMLEKAKEACDKDEALQKGIGDFNLKRMAINNEAQKEERDEEKIQQLNEELQSIYAEVLKNENMTEYNQKKTQLDEMVQRLTGIITLCSEGMDPETADYNPAACGGSCSSCEGCG